MSSHIVLSIRALSRTSDLCPAEWAEWPVLSPAPALAPAPSVRGEGGQTGPVRGGGSDRHRALSRGERAHGAGSMAPLYPHTPAPTVGRTGHWPGCTGTLDTRHPPSPGHLTPEPELPELIMNHSESAGAGG